MAEVLGLATGGGCALLGVAVANWLLFGRLDRRPARTYRHEGPVFNPSDYLRG